MQRSMSPSAGTKVSPVFAFCLSIVNFGGASMAKKKKKKKKKKKESAT
jgi:hypothetical protein